ncbi:MarC family protein [Bythopirellula goksoeyrii]|uniref:UPF0056 membrane protein n=1 Tax=Bythopirellula goksoeyrii TaxID=1400387 RepID=A0A5B9QF35_9BACT|nr:MarC family protein [Bythopirellula goksoeyrii]QEG36132.1 inner membrane protein [Bythopirellula goksoeyrii]
MDLASIAILLLATIGPTRAAIVFVGMTKSADAELKRKIALRTVLVSAIVCCIFVVLGSVILGALKISIPALLIAGGLILFSEDWNNQATRYWLRQFESRSSSRVGLFHRQQIARSLRDFGCINRPLGRFFPWRSGVKSRSTPLRVGVERNSSRVVQLQQLERWPNCTRSPRQKETGAERHASPGCRQRCSISENGTSGNSGACDCYAPIFGAQHRSGRPCHS